MTMNAELELSPLENHELETALGGSCVSPLPWTCSYLWETSQDGKPGIRIAAAGEAFKATHSVFLRLNIPRL